ncbi:hypothetical protein PRABACTJOHN_03522 [Parabacteroides johnsonii DSM 18315]|uniref:Uncharacterized protein n=1 Tax=Parabacteroides johnsonii DSM 18315 TaxID=537006 RepID=B7BEP2_9BACT|nr:hypothetical protein PRABACTJOHN_03522 [Parabacteroides johnsonii DSM 18315]
MVVCFAISVFCFDEYFSLFVPRFWGTVFCPSLSLWGTIWGQK